MWLSVVALALVCEAHVRLLHKPYFTLPIRNAPTMSADGTLSTAGPCGGVQDWGNKSYTTVTVGQNLSLVYAYNGGHQSPTLNMLRVAMVCGKQMSDVLLKNETVAPIFSPLVNASASSTLGYDLWVIIPAIPSGMNGQFCTISALDVRNWGGCVDVEIVAAGTPTPAPSNALTGINLGGLYTFGSTSCTPDSPACCCVSGTMQVTHTAGATTATATVWFGVCANSNGTSNNVNTSAVVQFTQPAANLASLKATVTVLTNTLTFQLTKGLTSNSLIMTDDSAVPYYCGFNTNMGGGGTPPGNSASRTGSGIAAIIFAALLFQF